MILPSFFSLAFWPPATPVKVVNSGLSLVDWIPLSVPHARDAVSELHKRMSWMHHVANLQQIMVLLRLCVEERRGRGRGRRWPRPREREREEAHNPQVCQLGELTKAHSISYAHHRARQGKAGQCMASHHHSPIVLSCPVLSSLTLDLI